MLSQIPASYPYDSKLYTGLTQSCISRYLLISSWHKELQEVLQGKFEGEYLALVAQVGKTVLKAVRKKCHFNTILAEKLVQKKKIKATQANAVGRRLPQKH